MVLAAVLWGRLWSKQHICFHSDNMEVVSVLTTMTVKVPLLMHLLRCLFFSAYFSFTFSAKHIPGALNSAADALSHNNLALFSSLFPWVQQHGIPPCLMDLVIYTRPDWGSPTWTLLFNTSLVKVLWSPPSNPMELERVLLSPMLQTFPSK